MKKILLILLLLPLTGFTSEDTNQNSLSMFQHECENTKAPVERQKNCLLAEKQKEAQEAYRDALENNHLEKSL